MGSTKCVSVLDAAGAPEGHKPEGRGRNGRVNPTLSARQSGSRRVSPRKLANAFSIQATCYASKMCPRIAWEYSSRLFDANYRTSSRPITVARNRTASIIQIRESCWAPGDRRALIRPVYFGQRGDNLRENTHYGNAGDPAPDYPGRHALCRFC